MADDPQDPTDPKDPADPLDPPKDPADPGDPGKGDDDKPSAELLKALRQERDRANKAEADVRRREKADREAEQARAIKAGEWESVAKAKDTEIADLNARIAGLEAEIASSRLETVRERVAAKHRLPPQLAARLRGTDEASLDADAKDLAKLVAPPKAPDTEAGKGVGQGGKDLTQEHQRLANESRIYTPY